MKIKLNSLKLLVISLFFAQAILAQSVGDYRSAATGNWSDVNTWERWNGAAWITPAPSAPTSTDGVITIRNTHTVTLALAAVTADQIVVDAGGNLNVNTFPYGLTLNDGPGDDLVVNGTFLLRGTNTLAASTGGVTVVVNGTMNWFSGVLQANTTISSGGILNLDLDFQKDLSANLVNNGTFNWSTGASTGGIFFNNATLSNNGTINEQFQSNRGFFPNSGTNAFINTGIFNKTTTFNFGNFGVPITNSGYITGIGSISLTGTINNTGTIQPGNSAGILAISDNLVTGQSPLINIEILGNGGAGVGHDRLDFNVASVDVSGSSLVVTEVTTVTPASFTIMNNTGGVFSGNFVAVTIPGNYSITYNPGVSTSIVVTKLGGTLPATWGDFTALARNGNQVQLRWQTLQETNVARYEVEYSEDGSVFHTIGTVSATGNSSSTSNYSFVHTSPSLKKTNFYRIKQVDNDNSYVYTPTRPVKFNNGMVVDVVAFPNPVHDKLQLNVQSENIMVHLVDMSGRVLQTASLQQGNNELNTSKLLPGLYNLVILKDGVNTGSLKIVKQ